MAIRHTHLLIIGSGPAGYTAAVYAARAMLAPVLLQGLEPGGQLTITTEVENWPGLVSVQGPELMLAMEEQARHAGAEIIADLATRLLPPKEAGELFSVETEAGDIWFAEAVILATGARAKWLGLASEQAFSGRGVSACATCDGFFFRGQDVLVVGGGNSAVEEALYLAGIARSVTLIHRRDSLKAEKILVDRLMKHPKISVRWNRAIEEIVGAESDPMGGVTGAVLRDTVTGARSTIEATGIFIAIGHAPASELVADFVATENGYVVVEPGTARTSVPGLWAAGDVADPHWRQAVTSAGMGCQAALDAERWLSARG